MTQFRAAWPLTDGRTGKQYAVYDVVPPDFPGFQTLVANGGVFVELIPDAGPAPQAIAPVEGGQSPAAPTAAPAPVTEAVPATEPIVEQP